MKKLFAVLLMCSAVAAFAEPAPAKYQKACFACHEQGLAGAPKVHDAAAWQPRLDKGMDALLVSVKSGFNAMPPGGLCTDCTDDDYKMLIEFMSSPAPAN